MALSQKQERVIKYLDEIKLATVHHLSGKTHDQGHTTEKTSFTINIGKFADEARKGDSHLDDVYTRTKTYVSQFLKRLPEDAADNVKSALHKMDLAIHGRK